MTDVTVRVVETPILIDLIGGVGPSLYDLWLADGNVGSLSDFFDAMISASGITVTGVTDPLGYTTRALMAGIASPANGQLAYLAEAGREGWFKFSTADNSANVTADPYQGLYVPPSSDTDGSSGAWVRIVRDREYHLAWWGTALNTPARLQLLSSTALLPAGSTLRPPPYQIYVQDCIITKDDWTLLGYGGDISIFKHDPAVTTAGQLVLQGSNIAVRNIGFYGKPDATIVNATGCLYFGANAALGSAYSNIEVSGCTFDNSRVGFYFLYNSDGTSVYPITNCRGFDNHFRTQLEGFSVFGAKDVYVHDCTFDMQEADFTNYNIGWRILGAENVTIDGMTGRASGAFGFRLSAMASLIAPSVTVRRTNRDIRIQNCHLTNCRISAFHTEECFGEFLVQDCTFEDDIVGTSDTVAIRIATGLTVTGYTSYHNITIRGCEFKGYSAGITHEGTISGLSVKANKFIGNKGTAAFPSRIPAWSNTGGAKHVEYLNNEFQMNCPASSSFYYHSSTKATVTGSIATTTLTVTAITPSAVVTASIAGTTLTVTAVTSGALAIGSRLYGANITPGTVITEPLGGTVIGGTGTYKVNISQTAASATVNAGALVVGDSITGTGVTAGTIITALGTGTGGTGTYTVGTSQTVASTTISATDEVLMVRGNILPEGTGGAFLDGPGQLLADTVVTYPLGTFAKVAP